ncbi:MAG: hypothetical protein HY814_10855 [Candidatus Riflebacteria bacterium]|nr:hypothetical protein [Candidatus Riflebacteria bacterium]
MTRVVLGVALLLWLVLPGLVVAQADATQVARTPDNLRKTVLMLALNSQKPEVRKAVQTLTAKESFAILFDAYAAGNVAPGRPLKLPDKVPTEVVEALTTLKTLGFLDEVVAAMGGAPGPSVLVTPELAQKAALTYARIHYPWTDATFEYPSVIDVGDHYEVHLLRCRMTSQTSTGDEPGGFFRYNRHSVTTSNYLRTAAIKVLVPKLDMPVTEATIAPEQERLINSETEVFKY